MKLRFSLYISDTALNFSKEIYNATIADHSIIDRAVTTLYLEGKDFMEDVEYTLTPENSSLDFFKIDPQFGEIFFIYHVYATPIPNLSTYTNIVILFTVLLSISK